MALYSVDISVTYIASFWPCAFPLHYFTDSDSIKTFTLAFAAAR